MPLLSRKGIRGPHGGYALARDSRAITADDILRAAGKAEDHDSPPLAESSLVNDVVLPALIRAEEAFSTALSGISVADLAARAKRLA